MTEVSHPTRRFCLEWLAARLDGGGLRPCLVGPGENVLLRVDTPRGRIRFVACVPSPQCFTWAYVWDRGWVLVTDPAAAGRIRKALAA
jgi:hypothetical protein